MKTISILALVFTVLTLCMPGGVACAGGANGGGYGNTAGGSSGILAGTGSSGGYGKGDKGKGGLVLAGSGNSGGYGHVDTGNLRNTAGGPVI